MGLTYIFDTVYHLGFIVPKCSKNYVYFQFGVEGWGDSS